MNPLRDILPSIADMRHLPATAEEWEAHDARIRAEREADQARAEKERIERMADRLRGMGCPGLLIDKALGRPPWPPFDETLPGPVALLGIEHPSCGVRILAGSTGRGKTLAGVHWLLRHGGRRPSFLRMADFVARPPWDRELRETWQTASALVLDDLAAEEADERTAERLKPRLDDLLDHFTQGRAQLVITTNASKRDFNGRYVTERMASRLRGIRDVWATVEGIDLRTPGPGGEP